MDIQVFDVLAKVIIPLATPLIVGLIFRRIEAKPRLITYLTNISTFRLPPQQPPQPPPRLPNIEGGAQAAPPAGPQPPPMVFSHGIVVRNIGKKTAMNVRIGHAAVPLSYDLKPVTKHEVSVIPEGGWEILIPTMVPNEQVRISYLYFPPVTWNQINSYTKSDEAMAEGIEHLPGPPPSALIKFAAVVLLYIGLATAAYLLVLLVQFIYTQWST